MLRGKVGMTFDPTRMMPGAAPKDLSEIIRAKKEREAAAAAEANGGAPALAAAADGSSPAPAAAPPAPAPAASGEMTHFARPRVANRIHGRRANAKPVAQPAAQFSDADSAGAGAGAGVSTPAPAALAPAAAASESPAPAAAPAVPIAPAVDAEAKRAAVASELSRGEFLYASVVAAFADGFVRPLRARARELGLTAGDVAALSDGYLAVAAAAHTFASDAALKAGDVAGAFLAHTGALAAAYGAYTEGFAARVVPALHAQVRANNRRFLAFLRGAPSAAGMSALDGYLLPLQRMAAYELLLRKARGGGGTVTIAADMVDLLPDEMPGAGAGAGAGAGPGAGAKTLTLALEDSAEDGSAAPADARLDAAIAAVKAASEQSSAAAVAAEATARVLGLELRLAIGGGPVVALWGGAGGRQLLSAATLNKAKLRPGALAAVASPAPTPRTRAQASGSLPHVEGTVSPSLDAPALVVPAPSPPASPSQDAAPLVPGAAGAPLTRGEQQRRVWLFSDLVLWAREDEDGDEPGTRYKGHLFLPEARFTAIDLPEPALLVQTKDVLKGASVLPAASESAAAKASTAAAGGWVFTFADASTRDNWLATILERQRALQARAELGASPDCTLMQPLEVGGRRTGARGGGDAVAGCCTIM